MENLEIKLLNPNDNKLRKVSTEVTDFGNPIYHEILDKIKNICFEEKAYASAAPQFGILKRIILIMTVEEIKAKDSKELDKIEINYNVTPYFNPRIISMKGKQYFYESCMSVDEATGKVARPYYIEIEAQDINGNYFYKKAEGFEAIVLCHEIDHLDGIEYTDKAEMMFYNIRLDERLAIRKEYPHEIISKDDDFIQDNIDNQFKTLIYKKKDIN